MDLEQTLLVAGRHLNPINYKRPLTQFDCVRGLLL